MKRLWIIIALLASVSSLPLTTARAADCVAQHRVLPGENLFRIGLRYGLQWPAIAAANGIVDPRTLKAGQELCIPARPGATATVTRTPAPSPSPTPAATATPSPSFRVPTFSIVSVVRDQTVTISAVNFPANREFDVLMGPIGTRGVNGTRVGTQNSGTGTFSATYNIPAGLTGSALISIRLQSPSGYFSYNWFHNSTAAVSRQAAPEF